MKLAYFDCQFGAGGDMLLAAMLDAGLDAEKWLKNLKGIALPNDSYKVIIEQVQRCSLVAKKVKIILPEANLAPANNKNASQHAKQNHKHDHHEHSHEHEHEHNHEHVHTERSFKDIISLIEKSKISAQVKDLSLKIFENLARAEAFVHGTEIEKVHFHEVGAIDSIIDIIGFAIAYEMLGIEKSIVSPLPLGSGTTKTQHGIFPIPGPATLRLLEEAGAKISNFPISYEALTPTAAAILTTIAHRWENTANVETIISTGYGAGDHNPPNFPNVCRIIIGEGLIQNATTITGINHSNRFNKEILTVIETMLDDFSPQNLSFTAEKLLEIGALDTYVIPVNAKKGRSGHLLTVICKPEHVAKLEEYLFEQTTTLGMRVYSTDRIYLDREWVNIDLNYSEKNGVIENSSHKIRIKVGKDLSGKIMNIQPEYEDCISYAQTKNLPLKTVISRAIEKFNSDN